MQEMIRVHVWNIRSQQFARLKQTPNVQIFNLDNPIEASALWFDTSAEGIARANF
jgi:hypothetical protein